VTTELFFQLHAVGNRTFQVIPYLVSACLWYLVMTSVLMVGQYYIERYFGRGYGAHTTARSRFAFSRPLPPAPRESEGATR
jgi:polar amino acid transport system permease protein